MHQPVPSTLANRLGITAPVTPLLMKLRRLSRGVAVVPWLVEIANQRGFTAVFRCHEADAGAVGDALNNEELAVAFLLPGLPDEPQAIRLAGQMISRGGLDMPFLFALASREAVRRILAGLAAEALLVSPANETWRGIADATRDEKPLRERLIHWTRLAEPVMRPRGPHNGEWRLVA